jgi:hypothetical protein
MTAIDTITQAMRDLTALEIRARLAEIDAETRLLRQLLRSAIQRDRLLRLDDGSHGEEVSRG